MRSNTILALTIVRLIFKDRGKSPYTYACALIVKEKQKGELQSMKIFIAEAGIIEKICNSQNGQLHPQRRNQQIAFADKVLETRPGLAETFKCSEKLAPRN